MYTNSLPLLAYVCGSNILQKQKEKMGGRADKTALRKRIDNNTNNTHNTETIQTDRRSQLNILVIQYLIQHVSA